MRSGEGGFQELDLKIDLHLGLYNIMAGGMERAMAYHLPIDGIFMQDSLANPTPVYHSSLIQTQYLT